MAADDFIDDAMRAVRVVAAAIARARALVVPALAESEFERLHADGTNLRDEDIAVLAFAIEDDP